MNERLRDSASSTAGPVLQRTTVEGIATLVLARPRQYNALSRALLGALHGELDLIAADQSVRVVIITGAGRAFCSGHDLKEMRLLGSQAEIEALFASCSALMQKLVPLPHPAIPPSNALPPPAPG